MRVNPTTDPAATVRRARDGEPGALGELYAAHAAAVMALAYRLTGSRADAEDVLHDVFLGLPEALRRYDERGSFESWLKRVAARAALTRMRSAGRRREVALDDEAEPSRRAEAEAVEPRLALERALARLPDGLRAVFVLKEVEGRPHAEVAGLLGITQGASEVRLCRAVKTLRGYLRSDR
jgi:RNA polymerase sigma-70 factor (ECF subfamily)